MLADIATAILAICDEREQNEVRVVPPAGNSYLRRLHKMDYCFPSSCLKVDRYRQGLLAIWMQAGYTERQTEYWTQGRLRVTEG